MPTTIVRARRRRVDVELPPVSTRRELRELGAFVRFCIGRIERELGTIERWLVSIAPAQAGGYTSTVTTSHGGVVVEARGAGRDSTLAAWTALGNVEQHLRELTALVGVSSTV